MLCGNGYGLIWTLSWLAHGCSAKTTAGATFSAAKSTKHRKYRCGRRVRGMREQHVAAPNKDPENPLLLHVLGVVAITPI